MIENYNNTLENIDATLEWKEREKQLENNPKNIKWTSSLKQLAKKNEKIVGNPKLIQTLYRPYTKKWLYFDSNVIHRPSRFDKFWGNINNIIFVSGKGSKREFSVIASDLVVSRGLIDAGQGYYQYNNSQELKLLSEKENINKEFLNTVNMSVDEVKYYIYGMLHSKSFISEYKNNLSKESVRIPVAKSNKKYIEIGKKLWELHVNYEKIPAYPEIEIYNSGEQSTYTVQKMKFAKKKDRTKIIFNKDITIGNIPEKAYEYIVNGRSAIEWIMDQYQVKLDKKSGIIDNPNDYSDNPKYIFNLLLSIINVSVQTVELVNSLPPLEIINED